MQILPMLKNVYNIKSQQPKNWSNQNDTSPSGCYAHYNCYSGDLNHRKLISKRVHKFNYRVCLFVVMELSLGNQEQELRRSD